jgi:hypothetical protein
LHYGDALVTLGIVPHPLVSTSEGARFDPPLPRVKAQRLSTDRGSGTWIPVATLDRVPLGALRVAERDGRMVCTGIHIVGEAPITASDLRRIPWRKLVAGAELLAWDHADQPDDVPPASFVQQRGRRGYSDGHYHQVAAAYMEALRTSPGSPIAHLQKTLRVKTSKGSVRPSKPTLHRWIAEARKRGFLAPATPERKRRAGSSV